MRTQTSILPTLVLGLGLWPLVSCSGNGGGAAPLPPPTIVGATFVGSSATPAPGDQLVLFLSRDVTLASGAILDDNDLTLASGSVGTVTAPPTLLNPRSVRITLGTGVALSPGATTVTFGSSNDAVRGNTDGVLAGAGTPQVIVAGDGSQPVVASLTLNGIDDELNGTGPAGGRLQVPRTGFTIDIGFADAASGFDPAATVVTANAPVATAAGTIAAGQDLTSSLTLASGNNNPASLLVPATVTFPEGSLVLTVYVRDTSGMRSNPATFAFSVRAASDGLRPFETSANPQQTWYLDLGRDLESYTYTPSSAANPIVLDRDGNGNLTPNGEPDIEDLFAIIGLLGSDGAVNATVMSRFKTQMLVELTALFPGTPVQFTFDSPGSFPAPGSVPYATHSFSRICIAGAEEPTGTSGVLGVALFDPHNDTQDDNCMTAFAGNQRLGVFLHTLISSGVRPPSASTFRLTYDPFTAPFGGVPIGNNAQDSARLAAVVQDARTAAINLAIQRMARVTAVIAAHECGHSMGLVQDGPMPTGLYGDDPNFSGSSPGHIRNDAQFPPGSQNVMSPAIGFESALSSATAFNSLNLAYLQERVLYN